MKKKLLLLLLWLPMMMMSQTTNTIMVIADPHVMAEELSDNGIAFNEMMAGQRKMLDMSKKAFTALIDTALLHHPSLVLIPGDLTKDGEIASHDVVLAQLNRLQEAGIKTLLIPGNHDIGGSAYSYLGENTTEVETLTDADWETKYALIYEQAVAKDANSHSYVAEPLSGITVIGIDASHNDGEGSLSEASLTWILQQADAARTKGNMIIAMCHWQLLEHVDEGGIIMESGLLQNAESVRDSLMAYGVRLVLTGHMHVNSISTHRDTLNMTNDSIVEISTGSPITYPCPYRWLTVSDDRSSVDIETKNITALDGYNDLTAYSKTWMQQHTMNIIPAIAVKLFDNTSTVLENTLTTMMQGNPLGSMVIAAMKAQLPKTDEEKIAIVNKYLTNTIIELYLLHSKANEHLQAESDSLAQALYNDIDAMMHGMTDAVLSSYQAIQTQLITAVQESNKVAVQSLVEDCTNWASDNYRNQTDDLSGKLVINEPQPTTTTAIENGVTQDEINNDNIYDILGRRISDITTLRPGTIYIQNGKKYIAR